MLLLLIVIYIVFISLGLPDSLFGVSWPVVHLDFGIEESFASVYSIIIGICTGGVSFVAGTLIRKFGTGKVTLFSIFLTAAGLVGISFSPNIYIMMIFSIILGYGAGAIDTGLNNFVSLHYKAQHMNWLHCFWGIGVTVSPIIMAQFLTGQEGSWRNGYRVVALMQLVIALAVLFTLPKWKGLESQGSAESEEKSNKSFIDILKTNGIITSIISLGIYCSMEFLLGTWGATYIINTLGLSPDTAAMWVSLYYGGIMLGRVISGFLSMKCSDNTLIRGGIAVSFIGIIVLLLPLGTVSLAGLLLIGIGFGPVFPSILHAVPSRFGKEYSADITGYHMGGAYSIGFAVQLTYGFVASATTFRITPFVLLFLCLSLAFFSEKTIRTIKNK